MPKEIGVTAKDYVEAMVNASTNNLTIMSSLLAHKKC